jgi:formamidopyrimidine-DNA glycosylase
MLWTTGDPLAHALLKSIGPEPLSANFDGNYLYRQTRGRSAAIKTLLMDSHVVAGVGNIYASEALFRAGIRPQTPGRRLTRKHCDALAVKATETLNDAIAAGGSSLRDYVDSSGTAGRFQLRLNVYDRAGEPCRACRTPIKTMRQGQRATYYCPRCQR